MLDLGFSTPVNNHITFLSHINDTAEEFQEEESLYSTNTIVFVPEGCCVLRIPSVICAHVPPVTTWIPECPQAASKITQHPGTQSRPFVYVLRPFTARSLGETERLTTTYQINHRWLIKHPWWMVKPQTIHLLQHTGNERNHM